MNEFGKFERVELTEILSDEDFTLWLADNMELLSDALDIDLELEGFDDIYRANIIRANIIAKDINTGGTVIIENHLEKSNHAHLGKILAYAVEKDALVVVWVCRNITDKHRWAIDWLNQSTEQGVNFFGLEIELWRIDSSRPAPKFNVVCRPNEWAKAVKQPKGF